MLLQFEALLKDLRISFRELSVAFRDLERTLTSLVQNFHSLVIFPETEEQAAKNEEEDAKPSKAEERRPDHLPGDAID